MFERDKAGEEEKSTSLGSDDYWRLTAAPCYSKFMPATCQDKLHSSQGSLLL